MSFQATVIAVLLLATADTAGADVKIDGCATKKNLFEQISCYSAVAKETDNLVACDQASHEGVRYQCYAIFAEYSVSQEICHKIPAATDEHRSLTDACLSDVAMKAHNPSLCERIATAGLSDSCYSKLAKEMNEISLCAQIRDTSLANSCNNKAMLVK